MVRVSASALVALLLPHFLTSYLDHDRFSAWALMLQIAAYVSYVDLGLQTAVARYLAQAIEREDTEYRDRLLSTAISLLCIAALVAALAVSVVLLFLPSILQHAPSSIFPELRNGVVILAASSCILLPVSAFTGVLVGLYRNEIPALAIGLSRLLGAAMVIVAVDHTHSLVVLAALIGSCNLVGGLVQYLAVRRLLPTLRPKLRLASRTMAAELARYCSTLTIWSLCMLLVGGLDVTIVGHYDFPSVGAYSIATMLIAFLTGINNSFHGALLAPLSVMHERGHWKNIRNLVVSATRITTFVDLSAVLVVFLFGHPLMTVWVGDAYTIQALPILKILVMANAIRLIGAPLSAALVASNQQHYGISGAIVEGISNFSLSIAGAIFVGAIGVAFGTLAGACISILWVILLLLRWLRIPIVSQSELILEGCLRPALCLLPIAICVALSNDSTWTLWRSLGVTAALIATIAITWRWGRIWHGYSEAPVSAASG